MTFLQFFSYMNKNSFLVEVVHMSKNSEIVTIQKAIKCK